MQIVFVLCFQLFRDKIQMDLLNFIKISIQLVIVFHFLFDIAILLFYLGYSLYYFGEMPQKRLNEKYLETIEVAQ